MKERSLDLLPHDTKHRITATLDQQPGPHQRHIVAVDAVELFQLDAVVDAVGDDAGESDVLDVFVQRGDVAAFALGGEVDVGVVDHQA
jgi:hypothetical protein